MTNDTRPDLIDLNGKDLVWRDVEEAISASTNPYSAMAKATERVRPKVWPHVYAEFPISPGSSIFTIGSCFARNVEDNLASLGYRLPTLDFVVPQEEQPGRSTNLLNKYTPASIYQEIAFAYKIYKRDGIVTRDDIEWLVFEEKPGHFLDLGLSTLKAVTFERLLERRQLVYEIFKSLFKAELVTITLGLVEAWFDQKHGAFIQFAPTREMRKEKGRFRFCQMTYPLCLDYVRKSIEIIREENECKFLITTSPVSLARTFTGMDVITANTESKSILRAVCGQIDRDFDFAGYFPSFESAVLTKSPDVYLGDNIHVSPEFVGEIVGSLVSSYFSETSQLMVAIQKARTLHLANNSEGVIKELEKYSSDPSFPMDGATLLLQAYARTQEFERAVAFGRNCEKSGISEARADVASRFYSALRNAYLKVGEVNEALRCAQQARAREPNLPVWAFEHANTLLRAERSEEAESIFRAHEKWIDSPARRLQFAQILKENGRNEEARDWLYPVSSYDMGANLYLEYTKILLSMMFKVEAADVLDNGLLMHPGDIKLSQLGIK
ncbi:GSCFA domain-containing protein [Shinella sp. CPCC 101442]|uniref:GSCFA domain-containing protein n=1 Tax=Shinella sp. CPCC 101442 TaxID=2932265 RepID=UPI002153A344|nr:GSCFA domain-containing protein [Shinella sp. CPCC 101442]MCR6500855.1 GSCFA domain-containing protein [Shinella sp. CPCC 101442]